MDQTTHDLPAPTRADVIVRRNARRTDRMDRMHHAKQAYEYGKGPRATQRRVRATTATAGGFGLVLLAAPCDAQTVPAAGAEASVSSLLGSPGATGGIWVVSQFEFQSIDIMSRKFPTATLPTAEAAAWGRVTRQSGRSLSKLDWLTVRVVYSK